MKKIINGTICTLFATYLAFAWIRYFTHNNTIALWGALCVGLGTAYISYYVANRIRTKYSRSAENKKKSALLADKLRYNADNAEVFIPLFGYYGYHVSKVNEDSLIAQRDGISRFVALCYAEQLSETYIAKQIVLAKRAECDNLLLFCIGVDTALQTTAKAHFDVTFVDIVATYILLETASKLPCLPTSKPTKKVSISATSVFCRKRFGWYIFGALCTAATSKFGYLRIYSLVWATVLFCLALFCLFNKRYNSVPTGVAKL